MASRSADTASSNRTLQALVALSLLACLAPGPGHGAEPVEGILSATDVLTAPGRVARLEARLIKSGFSPSGLGGEHIEFSVGNRVVGRAMTGGDGRAYLDYTPRMRGVEVATARVVDTARVRAGPAQAVVFSWERRRPMLLVELAAVLDPDIKVPRLPSLPRGLGGKPMRTAVPDAASELKRLAEFFYNVIYVARDPADELEDPSDIRAWLTGQNFPSGLVVRVGPRVDALDVELDDLRGQGWDHIKAGIGRSLEFADVLLRHRIAAILVPPPDRGDVPRKARTARDWKEVRKKLQG